METKKIAKKKSKVETKTKKIKSFKFKHLSSPINKDRAVKELLEIQKKHGEINNRLIVHYAKSKRSALHNHFTWDIKKAAEKQWLTEANELLRKLMVATNVNGKLTYTRAFINIQKDDNGILTDVPFNVGESTFLNVSDVLSNTKLRKYALARAFRELESFERKYINFNELSDIFKIITKTKKKISNVILVTEN